MKRRVVVHARAQQDIDEALAHYDRAALQVGDDFIDALEDAVGFLRLRPEAASSRFAHELDWPGLRSVTLRGFPYLVFFVERGRSVAVLRVLHQARDLAALLASTEE